MQLHQLQPKTRLKNKKRIGRGGKRGTYSGRGIKGQKARAGHRIRPATQDLIQRLPKLRGQKFKALRQKPIVINVGFLESKIKTNVISRKTLIDAGLIKKNDQRPIKILGKGEVKRSFEIYNCDLSLQAKNKILSAGGVIKS
jgi:large subunit ribosomal protein L15